MDDLRLCTVKPAPSEPVDRQFCFELVTPTKLVVCVCVCVLVCVYVCGFAVSYHATFPFSLSMVAAFAAATGTTSCRLSRRRRKTRGSLPFRWAPLQPVVCVCVCVCMNACECVCVCVCVLPSLTPLLSTPPPCFLSMQLQDSIMLALGQGHHRNTISRPNKSRDTPVSSQAVLIEGGGGVLSALSMCVCACVECVCVCVCVLSACVCVC